MSFLLLLTALCRYRFNDVESMKKQFEGHQQNDGVDSQMFKPWTTPPTRNLFLRIPETGGSHAEILLRRFLAELEEQDEVDGWKFGHENTVCPADEDMLQNAGSWDEAVANNGCVLASTQSFYNMGRPVTTNDTLPPQQTTYTLIRDPIEHVLSQYYHCKESYPEQGSNPTNAMPSLDEWLYNWVTATTTRDFDKQLKEKHQEESLKFPCFKPYNLQSRYVGGFRGIADLKERYSVVGLTSDVERSVCLIVIHLTGGLIPKSCDCSGESGGGALRTKKNRLLNGHRRNWLWRKIHSLRRRGLFDAAEGDSRQRKMRMTDNNFNDMSQAGTNYNGIHHETRSNTTSSQLQAISMLTQSDHDLYLAAQKLFRYQVKQVEDTFSIRLC